ncbi:uncharacterized protein [Fopius arisanus]|uniref:Uncharacterized protein isoform X2 n=1 Tax=Fopius arisanus TaxID=64838 RepID=A0A9R1U4S6_9HYME|nr:PREDICTED: uncharacterized protein LOC105269737 isoform X2 [Fopius arisanus]
MERIDWSEPDAVGVNVRASQCVNPVPESLKEVTELMVSVNRCLEDCAVGWQAILSKKQWRILDSQSKFQSWEHSLLARTYLADRILDEEFKKLRLAANKLLKDFNDFIGLLKGKNSNGAECMGNQEVNCPLSVRTNPIVSPLDLSLLDDDKSSEEKAPKRRSKRLAETSRNTAVLNGTGTSPAPTSEGTKCLCQICSSVLGSVIDNDEILREAVTKPKIRRMSRVKSKRLMKSQKIWKRNTGKIANESNR